MPSFTIGEDNNSTREFGRENFVSDAAPGDPASRDDHYYLAGSYPAPIGVLTEDEPLENFERALTSGDPRVVIHFNLDSAEATTTGRVTFELQFIWSGSSIDGEPAPVENILELSVNGSPASFTSAPFQDYTTLTGTFPTSGLNLQAGENTIELRRTGTSPSSWLAIDQISVALDPLALVDADLDSIPRYWEILHRLSDDDASDAAGDPDGDTLTNLAEFQAGTNPRFADTDRDGLNDNLETSSDPLNPDSDDDGLLDGQETQSSPALVDTDNDGASDAWELQTGYDPDDDQSTPPTWPGAIGINFRSESRPNEGSWPNTFPNGFIPQTNWNQTELLEDNGVTSGDDLRPGDTSNIAAPIAGIIVDADGQATSTTIAFTADGVRTSRAYGTPAANLLNGYLSADTDSPATLLIENIPTSFATYDLYVYLSTSYFGPVTILRRDGLFSQQALLRPIASGAELDFQLYRSSTGSVAPRANFVRFQDLTDRSISLEAFRADDSSIGISAIQIVDTSADSDSNGIPDWWQIRYRFGTTTESDPDQDNLSWLAEYQAGSDPWKKDTDGDGLFDDEEAAAGTDPTFADSDNDGLSDFDELNHPLPSNPNLADSDQDDLGDAEERASFSDPNDGNFAALPTPIFVNPGEVLWRATDLQFVIDHGEGVRSDGGTSRDFIDWQVSNLTTDVTSDFRIRLYKRENKIVFNVFARGGGSFSNEGNNFSYSDNNTDLTTALGLAGFGPGDTSDPLTFQVRAINDEAIPANWTVTFSVINQKTSQPVAERIFTERSAGPSTINGTTIWGYNDTPNISHMILGQGVRLFRTSTALEQLNGFSALADADNDGINDGFETLYNLNPNDPNDAFLDPDDDGLSNLLEFILATRPDLADSDGDGVNDGWEADQFTDPNSAASRPPLFNYQGNTGNDLNGNGMSDLWESKFLAGGLDPLGDADRDGYTNRQEAHFGSDPFDPTSGFKIVAEPSATPQAIDFRFPRLLLKNQTVLTSPNLSNFGPSDLTLIAEGENYRVTTPSGIDGGFLRVAVRDLDSDSDGLSDWDETIWGSLLSSPNSLSRPVAYDNNGDGIPDGTIPGDQAVYLERYLSRNNLPRGGVTPPPTRTEASRLLMQATFGPTMSDIEAVRRMGLENWIDDQLETQPATHHEDYIRQIQADLDEAHLDSTYRTNNDERVEDENLQSAFARAAVSGPDQLRQRVAFALSQILVISRQDGGIDQNVRSLARYYDRLVDHATGNYYDLLMGVTLDANMGRYLSHVGNLPPAPEINRFPDENYAREVMQLFSIGLWELNQDGTRKLDSSGKPIPTYDNDTITELARVMTGLWFSNNGWGSQTGQDDEHLVPLELFPDYHDFGEKSLLNGFTIPARPATVDHGLQDIRDAIRHLVDHPNCAPFISKSLIQFLVTSNPSPPYVERIANVFADNGAGERGDLAAVVKAILMDPEARDPAIAGSPGFGLLREPVVRTMHLARLTRLNRSNGLVWWDYGDYYNDTLQSPLYSPTVFNFYRPDYSPPGSLDRANLEAPAFEITNSYTTVSLPNRLWEIADRGFRIGGRYQFSPDYRNFMIHLNDNDTLLDYLNLVACGGNMGASTRTLIQTNLNNTAFSDPVEKARLALYLALMSPEGTVQR